MSSITSFIRLHLALSKARLSLLVLLTTFVGFVLAVPHLLFELPTLFWTMIGTGLAAAGANTLNQCCEIQRDSQMHRTRNRPLPSGQVTQLYAVSFGVISSVVGPLLLGYYVNWLAAGLALFNILLYVLIYTPMKPLSTLNTLVGAVCGGIPPMIGWAAATGSLDAGAWILGAILFAWQIPHFMALAWLYREDYERGGFRMLPIVDENGALTCRVIILYLVMMIPLAMITTLLGITGSIYAVGSLVLGVYFLWQGVVLFQAKTNANARRLFLASLVYLPFLLGLMIFDKSDAHRSDGIFVEHTQISKSESPVDQDNLVPVVVRY